MKLSIVVIFHDMPREAGRTLFSLSTAFQRDLETEDYEVIAIDNGSSRSLEPDQVRSFGSQFSYHYFDTISVSPVDAVNFGSRRAQGELLAVIVDGARMASPGLLGQSQKAAKLFAQPFVAALSWHLGPDVQNVSMMAGYNQAEEDKLLDGISWRENGYDLFDISTIAQSSSCGLLGGVPPEFSWFVILRTTFLEHGGFDPRFNSPGGGLVNQEFRERILALPSVTPVMLLGEGVFHQYHGGVATNVRPSDHPFRRFADEYQQIMGEPYQPNPAPAPNYFGTIPRQARRFLASSSS